jgi:hypothetical protein
MDLKYGNENQQASGDFWQLDRVLTVHIVLWPLSLAWEANVFGVREGQRTPL